MAKKEVIGIIYRKAVYFFEIMLFAMTICLADILCGCERKEVSTDNGEETVEVIADNGEKTEKKTAFLTFDDGPSCLTEKYLDILDSEGVKATFFVIGQQIEGEYKKTIKREIREGRLAQITFSDFSFQNTIHIAYHHSKYLSPSIKNFILLVKTLDF